MELHPKDLESLIQEFQERNREDVNYTDLLVLSQLNYDKWKRNRAKKCESKSARKEKEPNLKAPDMAAIMGVIEDASYNFISLNDDRINRYNVQSMDSSTFKEALEDLNIQLSSRERRALEGKYLLDAIGNIDFATFRADFISQGSQLMEERRMVTGATLEHASHQNISMSGIRVTTDKDTISRSLNDAFDASCSLENSMILNILGSPGNTQRASKGSQFMNKMVFTNVALEDIFAAAQSASNTPSKQSFACNTLERRKSSKGYLKPLQFPITSHIEQAPESHTITPAESTTAASEVSMDYHTKEVRHLGNSTDSDDESELDKHSSRRTSSKDSTGSSQVASRQSSLSSAVAIVERSEKAISASNDEIIEAISRRVEETALRERKASLLRAQSFQLEKRASLSQLDSLCPKPDYVPGKRRYSRDPTNHMKIIELTGRMEVKSSATKGNRDSGRGSVESEKEELDEEVDSDSDNTPNKMQFEK